MSNPIQNFYKSTITNDWSIGTGNFYVSVKPTTSVGRLVVSPSSDTLREIIEYTNTGTDGNGDYIVISVRGVGGTTEQTHTVGEKVRMNITAEDWEDMRDDIDSIVAAGAPNASTVQQGLVEIATNTQVIAGTDTGETGAKLVATPSVLNTQIDAKINTALSNGGNFFTGTAGEAITAGDAVAIASGVDTASFIISASPTANADNNYEGQTFSLPVTGKINSISIKAYYTTSGVTPGTLGIFALSGGLPTGAALQIENVTDLGLDPTITFASPVLLTGGTQYAIVFHYTGTHTDKMGFRTSVYSGGNRVYSSDGSSWTNDPTNDLSINVVTFTIGETGKIYKTDADIKTTTATDLTNNFIGFASENISLNSTGKIISGGIVTTLSGLTPYSTYYLSNTAGAIGTSAGSVSRKIGLALSTTSLLIKNDNI